MTRSKIIRHGIERAGLVWIEQPARKGDAWNAHFIGTFSPDSITGLEVADIDGDVDFIGTRGNSYPYDGVFWLEQVRSPTPGTRFIRARAQDSDELGLP